MTVQTFFDKLREYYGDYPTKSGVGAFVAGYITSEMDPQKLQNLLRYVLYSHPVNYGAPDIAAIEKAIDVARQKGQKGLRFFIDPFKAKAGKEPVWSDRLTPEEEADGARILDAMGGLDSVFEKLTASKRMPSADTERCSAV